MLRDIIIVEYTKLYAKEYNGVKYFKTICFKIQFLIELKNVEVLP